MKKLFVIVLLLGYSQFSTAQSNSLIDYVGTYKFQDAPFPKVTISMNGKVLIGEAEGIGKLEIFPSKTKDEFSEPENSATLVFIRDDKGQVVSLTIKTQENEMKGIKEAMDYVGKYKFTGDGPISELSVSVRNGELFGDTDQGNAILKSTSRKDVFEVTGYKGTAEFIRDSAGKVTKIILKVQDMTLNGDKL